jgi:uncharacterized protein (TIGR02246 family)
MKTGIAIAAMVVALLAMGCQPAPVEQAPAVSNDEIRMAVSAAAKAINTAIDAGDIEAYLAVYMDDAVWMPPGTEEFIGKARARQRLGEVLDTWTVDEAFETEEMVVMGPDHVVRRGQYTMMARPKEGGEEVRDVGSFMNVWHKDADGNWKIMFDIWNSDRGQPFLSNEQK